MSSLLNYALFDVILSAGLPVAAAYVANHVIVKRFQFRDYLGDGQLCFFATTLGMVTIRDLFESTRASGSEKLIACGFLFAVIVLATTAWAMAITAKIEDPTTAALSRRRITTLSLRLAGTVIVIGGIFKWLSRP